MSTHTDVIDRYFAIWNETDPARRRSLIAKTWTESANYLDPLMQGDGQPASTRWLRGFSSVSLHTSFGEPAISIPITTASAFPGNYVRMAERSWLTARILR